MPSMPTTDMTKTWSRIIDAVLQLDRREGYTLIVYSGDEELLAQFDVGAAIERAALLEATATLKSFGWEPTGRWEGSAEAEANAIDNTTMIRRFVRAEDR